MAGLVSVNFASFFAGGRSNQQDLFVRMTRSAQGELSMIRKSLLGLLGIFWAGVADADWALNMPRGITELSAETYDLHMMVLWVCVAIGILVFGVMVFSLVKHRKATGAVPATFSHSTKAEIIWTAIPIVILLVMVIPAAETMIKIEDARDPDVSIVAPRRRNRPVQC